MRRRNNRKNDIIEQVILKILIATIMLSTELHIKSIGNNRKNRKEEGLRMEYTVNSRKNYKAVMEMKSLSDKRGIG